MSAKRDFKRLQQKWYAKLKKKGFHDIEKNEHPNSMLSNRGNGYSAMAKHPYNYEETQSFYRLAAWFLHEYQFKSKLDQRIWELFCEGMTMRAIASDKRVWKFFKEEFPVHAEGRNKLSVRAIYLRIHKLLKGPFQDYRKMVFHDAN